jgi:hypothetical protein
MAIRDNVYNKLKTALSNAKISDAWTSGYLRKDEQIISDSTQETV